jgi:transcriptional regulator with XRE-family HTH domain
MNFSEKVRLLRKRAGLTQEEFGERIGVKVRSVAYYENDGRCPEFEVLKKMADLFDVTVDFLTDDNQAVNPTQEELFIQETRSKYGHKGESEAKQTISKIKGLMAGGNLDEDSRDAFYSVMQEIYFDSKERAKKYGANT